NRLPGSFSVLNDLFSMLMMGLYCFSLSHSFHAFSASGVSRFCFWNPFSNANCKAPSPTSITCGVFSITRRATETGCPICSKPATEPQFPCSSITQASSVTWPSRSGYPPLPTVTLARSASGTRAPASTASNARPPPLKIFHAAWFAATPKSQVDMTIGLFPALRLRGGTAFAARSPVTDTSEAPKTLFLINCFLLIILKFGIPVLKSQLRPKINRINVVLSLKYGQRHAYFCGYFSVATIFSQNNCTLSIYTLI